MHLWFISVIIYICDLFIFIAAYYSIMWIYKNVLYLLTIDGNVGFIQFGTIMNKSTISIQVKVLM